MELLYSALNLTKKKQGNDQFQDTFVMNMVNIGSVVKMICTWLCPSTVSLDPVYRILHMYGSGHEGAVVLLPGFAISW